MTLCVEPDQGRGAAIVEALADPFGALAPTLLTEPGRLAEEVRADAARVLVVLGPGVPLGPALAFAAEHRAARPALGVVLVRDRLEVTVLAEAIRAGVREVVPWGDVAALRAACERSLGVSRQLAPERPPTRVGQLVTVFAGKGGCGKSTMATNLAVALADGGACRVCLIDLDLSFGDIAIMMQLVPKRSLADAAAMAGRLDETGVRSLLTEHSPGLSTLLAPPEPAQADRIDRQLVTEILTLAKRMFDYVVVDTPPFFSDHVLAALDESEWYVLLATPDIPALKNLRLALDTFELLGYPAQRRLVVLNRADARVGLTSGDIDRVVRVPIAGRVPSTRDVPVSINRGVPLTADSPGNPVSRAVRQLVDEHLRMPAEGETEPPAEASRARRGLLSRRGR